MKNFYTLVTLSIALFSCSLAKGQLSFSHAVGASFYAGGNAGAPGIMYSPRLNFYDIKDEIILSVGTHIGLGLVYNSQEGASSFALDLPIVAEINFGQGADKFSESRFGGFFGAGYGISKIGAAGAFGDDYNEAAGLLVNAGVRAIIKEQACGLRVSYLKNSKKEFKDVISVGVFYTFGQF